MAAALPSAPRVAAAAAALSSACLRLTQFVLSTFSYPVGVMPRVFVPLIQPAVPFPSAGSDLCRPNGAQKGIAAPVPGAVGRGCELGVPGEGGACSQGSTRDGAVGVSAPSAAKRLNPAAGERDGGFTCEAGTGVGEGSCLSWPPRLDHIGCFLLAASWPPPQQHRTVGQSC